MSVSLSCEYNSRWQTLVAHTKWEWLVLFACKVDLVAQLLTKCAVLALLVGSMLVSTLFPLLQYVLIKSIVLYIFLIAIDAIGTLLICLVLTDSLNFLEVLLGHSETVEAFLVRTVIALLGARILLFGRLRFLIV